MMTRLEKLGDDITRWIVGGGLCNISIVVVVELHDDERKCKW